jgi:hypothetical protein
MKFIFNDTLSVDSNLFNTEDKLESVILSSNLIFEKSIRIAQLADADFDAAVAKYLSGDASDKQTIMDTEFPKMDDDQKKDFFRKIHPKDLGSSNFSVGNEQSLVEKAVTKTMDAAEITGEAAEKGSAKDVNRNRIISQLRSFLKGSLNMKEDQIGAFFDNIFSKGIPESELLEIAGDALLYSNESGTNLKTVLDFMISHYSFQKDLHLTREITKLASEVRQQNPDVNIFDILSKSAAGQIPDVAMVSLIDDAKLQNTVYSLISLSQMRVTEQNEAVRRKLQEARDGLQSIQERTNRQRGLVDALKMIEVDKTLTDEVEEFGRLFKKLMTYSYFRALRNLLYDISGARKLIDTWGTLFTDTQPVTPRQTDLEMRGRPQGGSDLTQQSKIDQRGIGRTSLQNNSNLKFIKVAQIQKRDIRPISGQTQSNIYKQNVNGFIRLFSYALSVANKENNVGGKYFEFGLKNLNDALSNPDLYDEMFSKTYKEFSNYLVQLSKTTRQKTSQTSPQLTRTPVVEDAGAKKIFDNLVGAALNFLQFTAPFYEFFQGNMQAVNEAAKIFSIISTSTARELKLNEGKTGALAPAQLQPGLQRAFVANNEIETDNMVGLSREESAVRFNLAKKRNTYKQTLEDKKKVLENETRMQVDLGEGSDGQTPLGTPKRIKELYEDLAKFLKEVVVNVRYEKSLLLRAYNRKLNEKDPAKKLDPFALKTVQAKLAEIENDLKFFQNEYGRISSTKLIAEEMARKQRLLQKLGPLQKELAKLAKAGFSPSGLMFNFQSKDPGGQSRTYGSMLYAILNEEEKALGILRNAYQEARKSTTPVDLSSYLGELNTTGTGEVKIT